MVEINNEVIHKINNGIYAITLITDRIANEKTPIEEVKRLREKLNTQVESLRNECHKIKYKN